MSSNDISWAISANCRPGELTLSQFQYAVLFLPNPDDPNLRIEQEYLVQLPKKLRIKLNERFFPETDSVEMISYSFKLQRYVMKEYPNQYKNIWVFSGRILIDDFNSETNSLFPPI